jgi:hypothetical protein
MDYELNKWQIETCLQEVIKPNFTHNFNRLKSTYYALKQIYI